MSKIVEWMSVALPITFSDLSDREAMGNAALTHPTLAAFITSHTGIFSSLGLWHSVIYGAQISGDPGNPHNPWTVEIERVRGAIRKMA